MNKQEAIKKLDFNNLLDYRERNRYFGNCDNQFKRLSRLEIIELTWIKVDFMGKIRNSFEQNDTFYAALKRNDLAR